RCGVRATLAIATLSLRDALPIYGQLTRLIGRVSMDMLTVDLTDLPGTGLGSRVELWGRGVSASAVAYGCGSIPYQLFCNVKRVRSEEHTSELQSRENLVCRLLLE